MLHMALYVIVGRGIHSSASDGVEAGGDHTYNQGWDVVGGLSEVVQQLKEMVLLPLMYPEVFQAMHLTPPRSALTSCARNKSEPKCHLVKVNVIH